MRLKAIYIFAVAAALAGCSAGQRQERVITVSILPQKYLLDEIVGGHFAVECLLANGSNPETYEPGMEQLMALERSEAFIGLGGRMGFERAAIERAGGEYREMKVYDSSAGVEVARGTHGPVLGQVRGAGRHGGDDDADPHVWTSVVNAGVIAQNMLQAVVELDPEHEDEYRSNFAALKSRLDSLHSYVGERLKDVEPRSFIVWHPSLSYFARDYGLVQISMEHEGKEAPVGQMRDKIDAARASGARIFFYQRDFDSRQISAVNEQIGAKMVEINPMSYDWDDEIKRVADALAAE